MRRLLPLTAFLVLMTATALSANAESCAANLTTESKAPELLRCLRQMESKVEDVESLSNDMNNLREELRQLRAQRESLAVKPTILRTMNTRATSDATNGDKVTDSEGPIAADICMLTRVSIYGKTTKGCALTQAQEGWTLVASARKSTTECQAVCFNLNLAPHIQGAPPND